MKKRMNRLQLHRETLRTLSAPGLRRIGGGTGGMDTTNACEEASWCACPTATGCIGPTWEHTCGGLCDSCDTHTTLHC